MPAVYETFRIQTRDERGRVNGFLVPLFNVYDGRVAPAQYPEQVYLTVVKPGRTKGPHLHHKRWGLFACIKGDVRIVLRTEGHYVSYASGEYSGFAVVQVPPGIPAAIQNVGSCDAYVLNMPTPAWRIDDQDEHPVSFEDYDFELGPPSLQTLRDLYPAPVGAIAHGVGTDAEDDLPTLWSLVLHCRPRIIVELGTRRAVSTETLAQAAKVVGAMVFTIDPADCRRWVERLLSVVALCATGEDVYARGLIPSVDLLFIDTDPHSFAQTARWLDSWCQRLTPGGVAVFHDTLARDLDGTPRPDIQVAPAVRAWCRENPEWQWAEYDGTSGLGVLRRPW